MNFTKYIIAGAVLITGGSAVPIIPAEMELLYSYRGDCVHEWDTQATTTREDPRPYIPECTKGEYAVSVFADQKGNKIYTEIPLEKYRDIGEMGGYQRNPTKAEYLTIFESLATPAEAAIAFDAWSGEAFGVASSLTFGLTTTGSNVGIIVGAVSNDLADTCRTATYNSVGMTFVDEQTQAGGGGRTERAVQFYSPVASPGTHNVVITCTGAISSGITAHGLSFTGVDQTAMYHGSWRKGGSATTSISVSGTTTVSGVWAVTIARDDAGSITNGTNYTARSTDSSIEIGDSGASLGGAGTYTVQIGGASGNMMMVTTFLAPATESAPESTTTPILIMQGDVILEGDIITY